jgi:exopolyphosphatase / guanosine-5'-triphosphate,3'-diphosphate pyrophosphatase
MRIAVVDIGTNTTRLLVADVDGGRLREVERRTKITRLGDGVDATGRLSEAAIQRVLATCERYALAIREHGAERAVAVLTAAVRDADNGAEFEQLLRERFGFEARTITGEREAHLTYLGATSARSYPSPLVVVDIGGGSTELVVGKGSKVTFHVSTRAGSVRHTERHLQTDPPTQAELDECRAAVRREIEDHVPDELRKSVADGLAVAGTATSFAAIDQRLEPYDRERVDGYRMTPAGCERILTMLAELPLEQRRAVPGLHPERAPTIIAGGLILIESTRMFGLESFEVSDHDILEGAALEAAAQAISQQ